jgi:hypothetical protein
MLRPLLLAIACCLSVPAGADQRPVSLGSFDRIRVQGPYEVTVTAGSPGGQVSGDRVAIDAVAVSLDGTTLVIRPTADRWQEQRRAPASAPVAVTLSTPALASAILTGAGRLRIARMKGERVDVSVSGTGSVAVDAVDAGRTVATVIGSGSITLAGRAANARLLANGTGNIDAAALSTDELLVRLEGPGEIKAAARYSAQVNNSGLGRVNVAGGARCQVTAVAGGPVICGQ